MSDASEYLQWQENSRKHLTEHRPCPLQMSDTEILDWLNEYSEQVIWNRETPQYKAQFTVYCDGIKSLGCSIREATTLAAAKYQERNS